MGFLLLTVCGWESWPRLPQGEQGHGQGHHQSEAQYSFADFYGGSLHAANRGGTQSQLCHTDGQGKLWTINGIENIFSFCMILSISDLDIILCLNKSCPLSLIGDVWMCTVHRMTWLMQYL